MADTKVLVVDDTGARAASLEENRNRLNQLQREALGEDLVLSEQTPQSQWSGITALALSEVGEEGVRAALYGSSVDHAQGVHLDAHGSLLDVRRRQAVRSRVTATVTGVAGTGLPAGSRAKTTDGDEFETLTDIVLSPEGVSVQMQAIEVGPVKAPVGTLTDIVTVVVGWETITNPGPATVGVLRESDADYKATYLTRTAHSSIGPVPALEGALEEALANKVLVRENPTDAPVVLQEWSLRAHSIIVFARGGSDGDIMRAVENHRGMGVPAMTAIVGGSPNESALGNVSNGPVTWKSIAYSGLDLSGHATPAARAAALTTHLAGTGVTVAYILGRYVAQFVWMPGERPDFGDGTVEQAFGLDPDSSVYPGGPFLRPFERALAVSLTLTRRQGFPGDGLDRVRRQILARVNGATAADIEADETLQGQKGYSIGEELWANDILCEAERVPGTRITNLVVQASSVDVSGVAVPLSNLWTLDVNNLTINVS